MTASVPLAIPPLFAPIATPLPPETTPSGSLNLTGTPLGGFALELAALLEGGAGDYGSETAQEVSGDQSEPELQEEPGGDSDDTTPPYPSSIVALVPFMPPVLPYQSLQVGRSPQGESAGPSVPALVVGPDFKPGGGSWLRKETPPAVVSPVGTASAAVFVSTDPGGWVETSMLQGVPVNQAAPAKEPPLEQDPPSSEELPRRELVAVPTEAVASPVLTSLPEEMAQESSMPGVVLKKPAPMVDVDGDEEPELRQDDSPATRTPSEHPRRWVQQPIGTAPLPPPIPPPQGPHAVPITPPSPRNTATVDLAEANEVPPTDPTPAGELSFALRLERRAEASPAKANTDTRFEAATAEGRPQAISTRNVLPSTPGPPADIPAEAAVSTHREPRERIPDPVLPGRTPSGVERPGLDLKQSSNQTEPGNSRREGGLRPVHAAPASVDGVEPSRTNGSTKAALPVQEGPRAESEPRPIPDGISILLPPRRESGGQEDPIALRLLQRGDEIRVTVRTPDPHLSQHLQRDLSQLMDRLEQQGFQGEFWRTTPVPSGPSVARGTAPDGEHQGREGNDGRSTSQQGQHGQSRRESDEQQPPQPEWVEEWERSRGH